MKFPARQAAAALMLLAASAAHSAIVSFSFSNTLGNVSGTVTGRLLGLADTGTSSATGIFIDSAPAGVGFGAFPVDVLTLGWIGISNAVTIDAGIVTDADILLAARPGSTAPGFSLNYGGINKLNNIDGQFGVVNVDGLPAITFTVTPSAGSVPEPATLSLVGAALIGFGMARQRRRRAV